MVFLKKSKVHNLLTYTSAVIISLGILISCQSTDQNSKRSISQIHQPHQDQNYLGEESELQSILREGRELSSLEDVLTISPINGDENIVLKLTADDMARFQQFNMGNDKFRFYFSHEFLQVTGDESLNESGDIKLKIIKNKSDITFKIVFPKHGRVQLSQLIFLYNFIVKLEPYLMVEAFKNANAGDFRGVQYFLNAQNKVLQKLTSGQFINYYFQTIMVTNQDLTTDQINGIVDIFRAYLSELVPKVERLSELDKRLQSARQRKKMSFEPELKALDVNKELFHKLVFSNDPNDRKAYIELLKKYLLLEFMPPYERNYWENYFNVLENPLPIEEHILVYRGLGDDKIQIEGGRQRAQHVDARRSIFSMMLTKNQGTWTRRLRSLILLSEKGKIGYTGDHGEAVRLTQMFNFHADKPQGSPFLSLTPSREIANHFSRTRHGIRYGVFLMDPRLLTYNYMGVSLEKEYLTPLVIFPDQVAVFAEFKNGKPWPEDIDAFEKSEVLKHLQRRGVKNAESVYQQIQNGSKAFFDSIEVSPGQPGSKKKCLELMLGMMK